MWGLNVLLKSDTWDGSGSMNSKALHCGCCLKLLLESYEEKDRERDSSVFAFLDSFCPNWDFIMFKPHVSFTFNLKFIALVLLPWLILNRNLISLKYSLTNGHELSVLFKAVCSGLNHNRREVFMKLKISYYSVSSNQVP